MLLNEQNILKILARLEAGNLVVDIKSTTEFSQNEINQVIKLLNTPNSKFRNKKLYNEITKREAKYFIERLELKEQAAKYIIDGAPLKVAQEKTKITNSELKEAYSYLNDPDNDLYTPKRVEELEEEKRRLKEERMALLKEKTTEAINCILNGDTMKKASEQTGISMKILHDAIEEKKTSEPELYLEIKIKQKETAYKRKQETGKQTSKNRLEWTEYEDIAKNMIQNNIPLEQIAYEKEMLPDYLYKRLQKIEDEPIKDKIKSFLDKYEEKFVIGKKDKKLREREPMVQEDIILLGLTFRISFESLAYFFDTTINDILTIFYLFDEYKQALNWLFIETRNENQNRKKEALKQAREYWDKRNAIVKEINALNKMIKHLIETNSQLISVFETKKARKKEELRIHHLIIDNKIIENIREKQFSALTKEERNRIAWGRVKYGLMMRIAPKFLHLSNENIKKCEEELALEDENFGERLELLNDTKEIIKQKIIASQAKAILHQEFDKNKMPIINPDYYNIKLATPIANEEEEEFRRGGGY